MAFPREFPHRFTGQLLTLGSASRSALCHSIVKARKYLDMGEVHIF